MSEQGHDPGSEQEFHAPSGEATEVAGPPTESQPVTPDAPHYHEVGSAAGEIVTMGVDQARAAIDGLHKHSAKRHARLAEAHKHTEAVHQQLAVPAQNRRAGRPGEEGTSADLAPKTYSERHRAARVNRRESRALVVGSGPQYRKEQIWGKRIRTMDYEDFMKSIKADHPGPGGFIERWRARGAKKKYDKDNKFIEKEYDKIDKAAYSGGVIGQVRGALGRRHEQRAEALGVSKPTTPATEEERRQAIENYRDRQRGINKVRNQDGDDEYVSPLALDMKARETARKAQLAAVPVWKAERDAEMARIAATPSYIHRYDRPLRPSPFPEAKPGYGLEGITIDNVYRLSEDIDKAIPEAIEFRVNEILKAVEDGKMSEEDRDRLLVQDGGEWRLAPLEAIKIREGVFNRRLARFLNVAVTEIGEPDSTARREELQVRHLLKDLEGLKRGERHTRRERHAAHDEQPVYLTPEMINQYADHLNPERLDNIVNDILTDEKIPKAHATRRDKYVNENKFNLLVKKGEKYNLIQPEALKVIQEVFDREIAKELGVSYDDLIKPDAPTKQIQLYLRQELMRRLAAKQSEAKTESTETE